MKQVRLPQFHDRAESVWAQFLQALPVIVFFLIMFYAVIFLFGMEYTTIVSVVTVIFQGNYRKRKVPAIPLIRLLFQQLGTSLLAFWITVSHGLSLSCSTLLLTAQVLVCM